MSTRPRIKLPRDFYSRYWQREPLLMRQAMLDFDDLLSGDDLAGLSTLAEVESRIVIETRGKYPWEVRHGPFSDKDLTNLPESNWTLLVQAVDHWDETCLALRRAFPDIPNWRLDDVMLSYAAPSGSVGPHVDLYDVFLIQASGRRRWHLGGKLGKHPKLVSGTELQLLSEFTTRQEFVLDPGDVLYLPPGEAHWGIALDECVTYSIGFRAPSYSDIVEGVGARIADQFDETERLRDAVTLERSHAGEIDESVIENLVDFLKTQIDAGAVADWFGRFVTEPKYERGPITISPAEFAHFVNNPGSYTASPDSRFAFQCREEHLVLYADGQRYVCDFTARDILERLCDGRALIADDLAHSAEMLRTLLRSGAISTVGEED